MYSRIAGLRIPLHCSRFSLGVSPSCKWRCVDDLLQGSRNCVDHIDEGVGDRIYAEREEDGG